MKPSTSLEHQLNGEQIIKDLMGVDKEHIAREKALAVLSSGRPPIVSFVNLASIFLILALFSFVNFNPAASFENQAAKFSFSMGIWTLCLAVLAIKESWLQRKRVDALLVLLRSNKVI